MRRHHSGVGWLADGWDLYLDNFFKVLPVVFLVQLATAPAALLWQSSGRPWAAALYMAVVSLPLGVGSTYYYLLLARGEGARPKALLRGFAVWPRAIAVTLLLAAMAIGGIMAFILPGVVLLLTFGFAEYALADRDTGVKDSFAFSARLTEGRRMALFPLFSILMALELMVPDPVTVKAGAKAALEYRLDRWTITVFSLKTLVFMPWLELSISAAYHALTRERHFREVFAKSATGT